MNRLWLSSLLMVFLLIPAVFAQDAHTYPQETIERGGQIFQSGCARCHGPGGDEVPGVNLSVGRFMRVTTDDELTQLITLGIPGTGMPSNNLPERDIRSVVAYLRSLSSGGAAAEIAANAIKLSNAALPGDAERGRRLFEQKGQCLTCHSIAANGGTRGPDLENIGIRRPVDLQRSILEPQAEIRSENRSVRVATKDNEVVAGTLLNHDTFTVQLLDSTGSLRSFTKTDLQEFAILDVSPMPSYKDKLTSAEITDIVKYLTSLRGRR
jgi:putative heme-binding domain-containing protein